MRWGMFSGQEELAPSTSTPSDENAVLKILVKILNPSGIVVMARFISPEFHSGLFMFNPCRIVDRWDS